MINQVDRYVGLNRYIVTTMSVIREHDKTDVTGKLANGAREIRMESGDDLYRVMNKIKDLENSI